MKRYLYAFVVSLILILNVSVFAMADTEVASDNTQPPRPNSRMDWSPDRPPCP